MPIADIAYLQTHDDPEHLEFPAEGTDGVSFAEVESLLPELSLITGLSLQIDYNVQDASFLTDLAAYEEVLNTEHGSSATVLIPSICLRFSNFGRMVAIYSGRPEHFLREPMLHRLIAFLDGRRFVYVPDELLGDQDPRPRIFDSWQIRFFDYL